MPNNIKASLLRKDLIQMSEGLGGGPDFSATLDQVIGSVFSATASKVVENSETETTLFAAGAGSLTLPVAFLQVGRSLEIKAQGLIAATDTPTIQIKLYLGTTEIADTGAVALPELTGSHAIKIEGIITCRTSGTPGSVIGQLIVSVENSGTWVVIPTVATDAIEVNTNAALSVDMKATWGAAAETNVLTITNATVKYSV